MFCTEKYYFEHAAFTVSQLFGDEFIFSKIRKTTACTIFKLRKSEEKKFTRLREDSNPLPLDTYLPRKNH
jgi:hypothetical protein